MLLLLDEIAKYKTVEDAAKGMAGNYKSWSCFVWFGEDDVPNSQNVMLGYLINNEHTLRQLTNLAYVKAQLSRWWGDITGTALVGDFGSSVSGDANVLSGLSMKVYDAEGNITRPFRKLYQIARLYQRSHNCVIDRDTFKVIQKREMTGYVHRHLEYECRERGVEFSTALVERVTKELISNELDFDNDDMDHEIDDVMGWVDPEEDVDDYIED